jgi:acyl-homoserine-lactone acylase
MAARRWTPGLAVTLLETAPMRCRHALFQSVALLSLLAAGPASAGSPGQILWDTFGIPHIYGPDLQTVVRGYGYAQMENQAETILTNMAAARGRSAEYFGAGAANGNVASDVMIRTQGVPQRAEAWLSDGGDFQRAVLQAFVDGENQYATEHGDTIDPAIRRVLPLVPADILADEQRTLQFTFMAQQDNVAALIAAWQQGGIAAANALAGSLTPATPAGSNGWAIAPQKAAGGHAMLMSNPHLPWGNNQPVPGLGVFQLMEANLVVGDPSHPSLNASGVAFAGAPFIAIGHSDFLGWTHTVNTIKNADLYELSLSPDGSYTFGGEQLPLEHRQDEIKVLQADGSLASQTVDIFASVHGPVVAQNGGKALALRVAGLDAPSLVTQYWRMIEAHDLDQFIAANAELQMPFFNVIYADRNGEIMYLFGGRQPVRNGGAFATYAGILPGNYPEALWTATFPWNDLPRAVNPPGGFLANSNDPPLSSSPKLTAQQVLAGKEGARMTLADRVLPDLIAAASASGNALARQAAAALSNWDHTAEAASKGAVLFERWFNTAIADPAMPKDDTINFNQQYPKFRIGWSAAAPLSTPQGLAAPDVAVADLVAAATFVQQAYGALDIAWGDVHKTVLVTHDSTFQKTTPVSASPESGPDDPFGPVRVVNPFPAQDGTSGLWSFGGDGYVSIVEFLPDGARAQALLTYGNASRPGSPHVTDQLPFFNTKTLRPAWRTRVEVEQHTVRTEAF